MSEIRAYPVSPKLGVPASIARPPYVKNPCHDEHTNTHVMSPETVEKMRIACKVAAGAKMAAAEAIAPGVTTDTLDRIAHEFMLDHQAYPSTLDYREFPKSCCTSVNEVICHGIPDARPLEEGDLVKIDVTAYIHGVHGDTCSTFGCGELRETDRLLMERTEEAMLRGIKAAKPGRQVNVIGRVIEMYAKRFGYGVVADYTGHGVNTEFHDGLIIPHTDDPRFTDIIEESMTFTVEPMLVHGSPASDVWKDGWTVVTKDKSWCAQFEHTVVMHADGAEILTLP